MGRCFSKLVHPITGDNWIPFLFPIGNSFRTYLPWYQFQIPGEKNANKITERRKILFYRFQFRVCNHQIYFLLTFLHRAGFPKCDRGDGL